MWWSGGSSLVNPKLPPALIIPCFICCFSGSVKALLVSGSVGTGTLLSLELSHGLSRCCLAGLVLKIALLLLIDEPEEGLDDVPDVPVAVTS